jgi:hypothetical protein
MPTLRRYTKKNAARMRGVLERAGTALYFEIDRLNMRLIFSLVASTAD